MAARWLWAALLVGVVAGVAAQSEGRTWGDRVQPESEAPDDVEKQQESCDVCDNSNCESPSRCEAGVVSDSCDCCEVCANHEGELCDIGSSVQFGRCGDNLECKKTDGEAICVCREGQTVCGSDGVSYDTPCALNEESARRSYGDLPDLTMSYWGYCKEGPVILSPPTDTYGPLGANLTLDCEAKGYPAPIITWQYENVEGDTISLPSDDQMISIQMRGGPGPLMVTGWAQILSLDPNYSGMYHCIATNSEGKVHAKAAVGVYRQ